MSAKLNILNRLQIAEVSIENAVQNSEVIAKVVYSENNGLESIDSGAVKVDGVTIGNFILPEGNKTLTIFNATTENLATAGSLVAEAVKIIEVELKVELTEKL